MSINGYIMNSGVQTGPFLIDDIHMTSTSGVKAHIIQGYAGINSVVYSLGVSEIDHIEVRPATVKIYDLDSSGGLSNGIDATLTSSTSGVYTIADSNGTTYGTVYVYPSSGYLQVNGTKKGYATYLAGSFSVIHQDGCESNFNQLISSANNSLSMDVGYRYYQSASAGFYAADCLGTDMSVGDFTNSAYGTVTLTATSSNNFTLWTGISSGSGNSYCRFSFDTATINDASYNVVISYDTLDTNYL